MPKNEQLVVNLRRSSSSLEGKLLAHIKQLPTGVSQAVLTGLKACYLGDLLATEILTGSQTEKLTYKKEIVAAICTLESLAMQLRILIDLPTLTPVSDVLPSAPFSPQTPSETEVEELVYD